MLYNLIYYAHNNNNNNNNHNDNNDNSNNYIVLALLQNGRVEFQHFWGSDLVKLVMLLVVVRGTGLAAVKPQAKQRDLAGCRRISKLLEKVVGR